MNIGTSDKYSLYGARLTAGIIFNHDLADYRSVGQTNASLDGLIRAKFLSFRWDTDSMFQLLSHVLLVSVTL